MPLYLQGLASPIGAADLSANPTDVNIDDKLFIVSALVLVCKLPVVITAFNAGIPALSASQIAAINATDLYSPH